VIVPIIVVLMLVAAIAALALGDAGTIAGLNGEFIAAIAASVALLLFMSTGLGGYRGRIAQAVKDFAIWVGLIFVLVIGYSYRDQLSPVYQRVAGELAPPGTAINMTTTESGERAVRVRRRANGHFVVKGSVNGAPVAMLVDTGASQVVLTTDDARRAGVDISALRYEIPVQTANGTGYAAVIRIKSLSVGGIKRNGVEAMVARPGALRESLLGMSFLKDLRYEFSGEFLTLRG